MSAPVSVSRWQHHASCKSCGYSLRSLPKPVCPECGTAFDPHDPKTMCVSAWVNWLDRTLLGAPGWISHVICAVPLFFAIAASADWMTNDVIAFSMLAAMIISFSWIIRLITFASLRSYYGHAYSGQRSAWGWAVTPALVMATIILWFSEI